MTELSPLSAEETTALVIRAQEGSPEAFDELAKYNMGLVRSIARRFAGRGTEEEDLIQIGAVGFIKAVKRYDPAFNTALSTYAFPLIAGEIRRFLRDDGMVKVSRRYKELAANIVRLTEEAISRGSPAPKVNELAEALGEDPLDVTAAMEAAQPLLSLNEPVSGDDIDTELIDTLPYNDPSYESAADRAYVSELISKLEPFERRLIELRFYKDLTQTETAKRLGISQVRVSRAESKIIMKLRLTAAGS